MPKADGPILIISGTNRPNSSSLRIAQALEKHYKAANAPAEVFSLTDLPTEIFLPSAYASKPPAFVAIQQKVLAAAGVHVVTAEYNGSFPGILKYFIDMLKFPESFERKPAAFVGIASGMFGALRAVEQLQLVFGYRNAHIYPERVFIPTAHTRFDPSGAISDPEMDARLARQAKGFATFATHVALHQPPT